MIATTLFTISMPWFLVCLMGLIGIGMLIERWRLRREWEQARKARRVVALMLEGMRKGHRN